MFDTAFQVKLRYAFKPTRKRSQFTVNAFLFLIVRRDVESAVWKICHEHDHELARIGRFNENICETGSFVETDIVFTFICRMTYDRRFGAGLTKYLLKTHERLHTVHAGHAVIEEDQIVSDLPAHIKALLSALCKVT